MKLYELFDNLCWVSSNNTIIIYVFGNHRTGTNRLTKDTQFIVISHRKGTMEAADILYGITMQEKGVSTLVSVNLIENDLDK